MVKFGGGMLWWQKSEMEVLVNGTCEESGHWMLWVCLRRYRMASASHQRKTENPGRKAEKTKFLQWSMGTWGFSVFQGGQISSLEKILSPELGWPWLHQGVTWDYLRGAFPLQLLYNFIPFFPQLNYRNMVFFFFNLSINKGHKFFSLAFCAQRLPAIILLNFVLKT